MSERTSPYPALRSDRWLLAICMGLSLVLWLITKMGQNYDYAYTIELEYHLPEGFAFRQMPPRQLTLYVNGSGWNMLKYNIAGKKKKRLRIEITQTTDHTLFPSRIKTQINKSLRNFNLSMISSSPEVLEIYPDTLVQKKVPLVLQGKLQTSPIRHLLHPPVLKPDSVNIQGAKSLVEGITQWPTVKIEKTNIDKSMQIPIKVAPPENELLKVSPQEVNLLIEVEDLLQKEFFVPVKIVNPPQSDSLAIFPAQVQVKTSVGRSYYDSLQPTDFEVIADFSQVKPGSDQTTLALQWGKQPAYVESAAFSPQAIELRLFKKEE